MVERKKIPLWNPEDEQILIDHYAALNYSAVKITKTLLKAYTPQQVHKKAQSLGISRQRWSQDELDLLEAVAEMMPFTQLVLYWNRQAVKRGFSRRTKGAINKQLIHLGLSRKPVGRGWNARALALGIGISHSTVNAWITQGKLTAKQCDSGYWITPRALSKFVLNYPGEFRTLPKIDGDGVAWLLQAIQEDKRITDKHEAVA